MKTLIKTVDGPQWRRVLSYKNAITTEMKNELAKGVKGLKNKIIGFDIEINDLNKNKSIVTMTLMIPESRPATDENIETREHNFSKDHEWYEDENRKFDEDVE